MIYRCPIKWALLILSPTLSPTFDIIEWVIKMEYKTIIKELISLPHEEEWLEFKENWFKPNELGEYISAMSNAAAIHGRDNAFFIWGINDENHEIVGTNFDYKQDIKREPLEHYLARMLYPSINFHFVNETIDGKDVVILVIPAANTIPTSFDKVRYLRIGSSKVNLNKFPERELALFNALSRGIATIENTESDYQNLEFKQLFQYYANKGITLKESTFKTNLGLVTKDGKYNIMAQLLSDDSHFPIRVSMFSGNSKASPLYSVKEFGFTCILTSLNKLLDYGDAINIPQADESNRKMIRKEIMLFDQDAFREALINCILHNHWIEGNEPMITVYDDRMEILSRGPLAPNQTINGFYSGASIPVNKKLSEIFLQLHISEKSGRGVPIIVDRYGKDAFVFNENSIMVTIPFNRINGNSSRKVRDKVNYNVGDKVNKTQAGILKEMRNNPNVTLPQLMVLLNRGKTSIQNNVSFLRKNGFIERVGSNKNGYWKVND